MLLRAVLCPSGGAVEESCCPGQALQLPANGGTGCLCLSGLSQRLNTP